MPSIPNILGIDEKRAEELMAACYSKLAEIEEKPDNGQISEAIKHMFDEGRAVEEKFFAGYILGRVVQINAALLDDATPWIQAHLEQLEKAKDERKTHPEFS